jgi:hypothetical protein
LSAGAVLAAPIPDDAPAIRTLGLGPFALALPREARDDMRGRIESDHGRLRRDRAEVGRSLLAVQRALLAEPFDREAAARALGRSREAAWRLQAQGHGALLDTLEEMSLDERVACRRPAGRALRRLAGRDRDGDRGP